MRIAAELVEEILDHCRAELPNEGCGLLGGRTGEVSTVYRIPNVDASPVTYTIQPEGHFRALQDAENRGLALIGAFHSHVDGPARPSATDVARAAEPDWVWLVAGPMSGHPALRAFRIEGGVVVEEELDIVDR